ncbi:MAG: hypothetical protein WC003_16605 [Terrimicrobiaceae bacterium]
MTKESAAEERKPRAIAWYRTRLEPEELKSVHRRSDWRGLAQTLGYLGLLTLTGSVAFYSTGLWPWPVVLGLLFLHGTFFAFLINGVHELGHGTVFRTKALNAVFDRVLSFLAWMNFEIWVCTSFPLARILPRRMGLRRTGRHKILRSGE